MKRVRITLSPPEEYLPPVYRLLTVDSTYLSTVQIVNWNVADPPVGFLLCVVGEYDRLGTDLDGGVLGGVSPRQREAVRTALAVGYDDVPREATLADVAAETGCSRSTAAEHLQKAETAVFSALCDPEGADPPEPSQALRPCKSKPMNLSA